VCVCVCVRVEEGRLEISAVRVLVTLDFLQGLPLVCFFFVCVCERERERDIWRERESECVCVCVWRKVDSKHRP